MLKVKMKTKPRSKIFKNFINRIFYVKGFDEAGDPKERWIIMDRKLNKTIDCETKKLNKTIDLAKKTPTLGDLVTHKEHPLGIGLVVEKHPELNAFRINWVEHSNLTLFIASSSLIPINKEHAHEDNDL